MKRLLCIVSSLDTGGAETFLMKLYRKMPDMYKIDFIVSKESGFYEDEVISLGGVIYRIPLRTKNPIKAFNEIRKIVSRNHYKYILKLCDTPIGYFDLLAAKMGGAKQLCVRSCNAASSEGNIKKLINAILRPLFNNIATVKIAPSRLAAEYTFGNKAVKMEQVHFLHNAVDLDSFSFSEEKRNSIREEFGIEKNQLVVGHVGRFNIQKNHEFLIDVFYELLKKYPCIKLILVGDGELKPIVENRIKEKGIANSVICAGVRSDIPSILSAMDVFLLPSFFEGMPNTVIEAQATGLPCYISDTITREAAITDLVTYLPITDKKTWMGIKIVQNCDCRNAYSKKVFEAGYEISEITKQFIELVFKDH